MKRLPEYCEGRGCPAMDVDAVHTTMTDRGFVLIEFTDLHLASCSLQESSLADQDAIWFGVNNADPKILATDAKKLGVGTDETTGWVPFEIPEEVIFNTRMLLTQEHVRALLPALHHFVETGLLPLTKET